MLNFNKRAKIDNTITEYVFELNKILYLLLPRGRASLFRVGFDVENHIVRNFENWKWA